MDKKSMFRAAYLAVLLSAGAIALTGCGGGDDEGETTTVGKVMFPTFFGAIPSPGDAQRLSEALKQSGVEPLGTKCGQKLSKDAAGNVLLTISSTVVLLVEIKSKDLAAAEALGYEEVDDKYRSLIGEVWVCEDRRM